MSFSIDLSVLKKREDDAKEYINRSSPMLICNADFGILFIASNKDKVENRVHKIHDRTMCVTRGLFTHGLSLWQNAVNEADMMSMRYSRGDVSTRRIVQQCSQIVAQSHESLDRGPLKVEIVFAGLGESPEKDYIGYIDYQGRIRTIQNFQFIGSFDPKAFKDSAIAADEKKKVDDINKSLFEKWSANLTVEEVVTMTKASDQLADQFFDQPTIARTEIAVLDRKEFQNKKFNSIFKRLNS